MYDNFFTIHINLIYVSPHILDVKIPPNTIKRKTLHHEERRYSEILCKIHPNLAIFITKFIGYIYENRRTPFDVRLPREG